MLYLKSKRIGKGFKQLNGIVLLLLYCLTANAQSEIPNQEKEYYNQAYNTLQAMLEGREKKSFKKAVFTTENAFLSNQLDYVAFDQEISDLVGVCKWIIENNTLIYPYKDKAEFEKYGSIFTMMTDSIPLQINDSTILVHLPYSYDFEDIWGDKDWSKMFVTKLLQTNKGNCHSLPFLYKILAKELGAKAYLAMAPNHVYIKHWAEKAGWYNTELTNPSFPIDAWIMASGYIHLDAIRNRMYMDTLSLNQSIAVCLLDLAEGYKRKFGKEDGTFLLKIANQVLTYYPHYVNALIFKVEMLKHQFELVLKKHDVEPAHLTDLFYMKEVRDLYKEMQDLYISIHWKGYRRMPKEMYVDWLAELEKEKEKYMNKAVISK